ncbi:MAG: hypothetical protein HPY59_10590 [Anaerolineae bacterium]|nr:hypothetical protein [Anaerolineae bacterium]
MRIRIHLFLLAYLLTGIFLLRPPARLFVVSPQPGEVLQGVIPIIGSTVTPGFLSYEVSFTYDREDSKTWFLIQQSNESVQDGNLAVWDTTTITDGDYRLRVQVFLEDGQSEDLIVSGLRVRNYTPIEQQPTSESLQPPPLQETDTTPAISATMLPTPTPLPENPAQITSKGLANSLLTGLALAAVLFLVFGLYLARRNSRRRRR